MPGIERTLTAADGTAIFVTDWLPAADSGADTAAGGILLMHGLGEHCGRYGHVARFFNDCGLAVRTYDHRGHGRSGGKRGDVPDSDSMLHDAKMVFDDFARQFATPPMLLGHSMGGLLAARFAAENRSPLSALILSSPALAVPMSQVQKLLLKIFEAIAPGYTLSSRLDGRYLSHDPGVNSAVDKDALAHTRISARLMRCMLTSIEIAHAGAQAMKLPILMVVAGDDHFVDAKGSQVFFGRLPSGTATMHLYPEMYHEVFNEVDAHRVFEDVRSWLQKL
ncbi:MAG: alpha/beta hydrolase [Burkholderiales bacterium]